MGPGELEVLLEAVREAEAVHEPEQARDQDAPLEVDAHDVLERHVDDRCSDGRLDEGREPRARRRQIERRAQQRERMRDGENGDDRQDLPPATQRNHQAKQEEQMIVAGKDVRDAEPDEARGSADPRGVQRDRSRAAGNDHRPAVFAGRHIAQCKLEIIPQFPHRRRANGKHRARRTDRIGDPGVHVALIDVNARVAFERLGYVARGLFVALE